MKVQQNIQDVEEQFQSVRHEIGRCVVGLSQEIELLLYAVVSGRHVLVEGVPGLGKTLLVKTLAKILGCIFRRIQFTPDMMPADILGGNVYNPQDGNFTLRRGPVFANVLLADEINRAPAKTQSALLEVMQEIQVTIEGESIVLERPFFVFATQNPLEHEGVYPLPQAQLDRFGMRLLVSYPNREDELRILEITRSRMIEPRPVMDRERILACQQAAEDVTVAEEIMSLIVSLVSRTRTHEGVLVGGSPRMSVDLMHLSRARALLAGRDYVIPDDIKMLFPHAANHRLILSSRAQIGGLTVQRVIHEALQSTKLV